jgi:NAD(P)H-hydrate epimerase
MYTGAMVSPLVLTRDQVRNVDRIAVDDYGMSSLVLMENAGRGVVDVLLRIAPTPGTAAILCGKGNNAGDGFVIARHLHIRGVDAKVVLLLPPAELTGDARANYEILARGEFPIVDLSAAVTPELLNQHAGDAAWLVDAMLGTGAIGEPREPLATAIRWMNEQPARRLAVDIPSGLDCDTGVAASATIRAEVTCTFVAMKPGFVQQPARAYLGETHVVSIGVPPRVVQEAAAL